MKNKNLQKIIYTSLLASINIVGSYLALNLRLPIYLDCIGTIFSAILFGPYYGALCGIIASLISSLFDYYSLFFIPSSMAIGILVGIVKKFGGFKRKRIFLSILIITLITSSISTIIVARVFGGISSSASSYIVQFLKLQGLSLEVSVFISQIFTDYLDKFISIVLVLEACKKIPSSIKRKVGYGKI